MRGAATSNMLVISFNQLADEVLQIDVSKVNRGADSHAANPTVMLKLPERPLANAAQSCGFRTVNEQRAKRRKRPICWQRILILLVQKRRNPHF